MRVLLVLLALVFGAMLVGPLAAQADEDHVHDHGPPSSAATGRRRILTIEDVLSLQQNRERNPLVTRDAVRGSTDRSGDGELRFEVTMTSAALPDAAFEANPYDGSRRSILECAHGGFAYDHREGRGDVYWFLQGLGILRLARGSDQVELVDTAAEMKALNMHNATFFLHGTSPRIAWPAEGAGRVYLTDTDGRIVDTIGRPPLEQYQGETRFAPTDTAFLDDRLWVTDGYGSRFVTAYDVAKGSWTDTIFGGPSREPAIGRFGTNHGLTVHRGLLWVSGRAFALIHSYRPTTAFASMFALPAGSKPCDFEFFVLDDELYGVAASLEVAAGDQATGAAIYIVKMSTLEVVSTVRPRDGLGLQNFVHLHNVFPVVDDGRVRLFCQAWNPGDFAVLTQVD